MLEQIIYNRLLSAGIGISSYFSAGVDSYLQEVVRYLRRCSKKLRIELTTVEYHNQSFT